MHKIAADAAQLLASPLPGLLSYLLDNNCPGWHTGWPNGLKEQTIISEIVPTTAPALDRLRRRWLLEALVWAAVWLAGYLLLLARWEYAQRWLFLSGTFLAFFWWRVRSRLDLNRRTVDSRLLPTFGAANQISLFRGLLLGLVAGFLFSPWPAGWLSWLIAGLYTAVSIGDALDGYVARRSGQVTQLGEFLDMEFDGAGVAVVSLLGIGYGQLPAWFLLVGFARYVFIAGLWLRERRNEPVFTIPHSQHRRILAGVLMAMMTVVLWPIVPPAMSQVAAAVIGIPVLLGFVRDWLFASGSLDQSHQTYLRLRQNLYRLLVHWLPLIWRVLLATALLIMINSAEPWYRPTAWQALLQSWQLPAPTLWTMLLAFIAVAGACCIAVGLLGRLWAILLLLPIGFDISTAGLNWVNGLALVSALMITLFGSGPYALWRPEEVFLIQRGERKPAPAAAQEESGEV